MQKTPSAAPTAPRGRSLLLAGVILLCLVAGSTPRIVGDGVEYGFKWWIYPYGSDGKRTAWGGSGLGGQRPIVIPEHDLVIVFTGWNLLPGQPSLSPRVAIDRIVAALDGGR